MFDDPREQANGHFPYADDAEKLPVELEPVHELLVTTSEEWRSGLPTPAADRLATFARNLSAAPVARTRSTPSVSPRQLPLAPELSPTLPSAIQQRPHPLPAIAAAVAVVTLLGGLLVHVAQGQFPVTSQKPTATASSVPTAAEGVRPGFEPITGQWSTSSEEDSNLVVSMSDPNVLYHAGKRLERSDNGGKTWRTIPTPQIPVTGATITESSASLMVSTGDPNILVIEVAVTLSSENSTACPSDTRITNGGQPGYCQEDFASRDGGDSWQPIQISGMDSYNLGSVPQATGYLFQQGQLLFGAINETLPIVGPAGMRIVTSIDGVHWQFADATLRAQAGSVCDFQAAPDGTVVYAITLEDSRSCVQGFPGVRQIWRSDDDGVSWTQVGSVKNRVVHILGIMRSPSGGPLLVYIGETDSLIKESYDVRVSADGGITWQNAPTSGIPANQEMLTRVFGTLSDDSIVEVYAAKSVSFHGDDISVAFTCYAWRMGDATWRRVSPSLTALINSDSQFLATQTDLLYAIAHNHDNTQVYERVYTFAA